MNPLRSLFGLLTKRPNRRTSTSKRPQPFRPALEVLEARETPSSLAHSTDTSGFLSPGLKGTGDGPAEYEVVGHGHNATYVYIGFP
jgi:hypothetical protein